MYVCANQHISIMIKLKEIPLLPSHWMLDIVESRKETKELHNFLKKRYAIPQHELDALEQMIDMCTWVKSSKKSVLKGEKRILIIVSDLRKTNVLVHELVHALWYTAKLVGYEMDHDSQEWQAVLYEYLYVQATDLKSYKKVK